MADKVLADGKTVGISVGRGVSNYYRRMISMAFIDPKYTELGKELTVVWGDVGHPQKEIRATVVRYPYFDADGNNEVDVSTRH